MLLKDKFCNALLLLVSLALSLNNPAQNNAAWTKVVPVWGAG